MRNKFIVLSIVLLHLACTKPAGDGFEINGSLSGQSDGIEVFLFDMQKGRDIQKSILKDGKFRFYGKVEGVEKFMIHDATFQSHKTVWLENSMVEMEVIKADFESAHVIGSEIQKEGELWEELITPLYKKREKLNKQLGNEEQLDDSLKSRINKEIATIDKEITEQKHDFIKVHSDFKVVSLLLFENKEVFGKENTRVLYANIKEDIKSNYWGKKLDLYLNHSIDLSVGDILPDILLPDISGKNISIESYRGNYVLLEFWESACHACIDENALLRDVYRNYHPQGFEIYAVSLDHEKSNWQETLERDSVSWNTVSDLKGLNGDIAIRFEIEYLPLNYLIDPNGLIISKNIRGSDLMDKLEGIYSNIE